MQLKALLSQAKRVFVFTCAVVLIGVSAIFGHAPIAMAGASMENPIDQAVDSVAGAGTANQVKGKAKQDIGRVQSAVDDATDKLDGRTKQIKGRAQQDIGRTQQAAENTADDVQDSVDNLANRVKNFFD